MIIREPLTRNQELKKMEKNLKGRDTKEKFKVLLSDVTHILSNIQKLNRIKDETLKKDLKFVIDENTDTMQTTSKSEVLYDLLECREELKALFDDMKLDVHASTFQDRLENCLVFIKDYSNKRFNKDVKFYQVESTKFGDQIESIAKELHYKVSKYNHRVDQIYAEIKHLEDENIKLVEQIEGLSPDRIEFRKTAEQMTDNEQLIERQKVGIESLRKSMRSYAILASLFEQLGLHEAYHKHLKIDGYTKRLVKRIYRKPEAIDEMEQTLDLTEVIVELKKEIEQIDVLVDPAQRMIVEEKTKSYDQDIINKYKRMKG